MVNQNIESKILQFLGQHPDGADDDELARVLNIKYRQQANSRCRRLAKKGIIDRYSVNGKIRNFWKDNSSLSVKEEEKQRTVEANDEPWFWEGNIQSFVCQYLKTQKYDIIRSADTKRREAGKDIEAKKNALPCWVTVKGYPKGTQKTRPSTQAGHWFKQALFDVISWRWENKNAEIIFALPDYPRYRKLSEKVIWLQPIVRFSIFWVRRDGNIEVQI